MTDELAPIHSFKPLQKSTPFVASGPAGIGGWLILPMLGMILTPIAQLITLIGASSTLSHLDRFGPLVSGLAMLEGLFNFGLFFVVPVLLLIQFFGASERFPRWYIAWTVASAIFVVLDLIVGWALFHTAFIASGRPFFDRDAMRAVFGALARLCIWVPYMMHSERVRNTFVC
jgi:hypothetical protein